MTEQQTLEYKPLSPKQAAAVQARLQGMTYEEIARETGYHDKSSVFRALTTNVNVKRALTDAVEDGIKANDLTPDLIVAGLWKMATNRDVADGARVRAYELLGKTDYAGALFSDRIRVESDDPLASVDTAVELLNSFMADLIRLSPTSLSSPLKTPGKPLDSWSEDDLKLFIYTHYGLEPPKSLITLDI